MQATSREASGFGRPWFALTIALALHVLDEATTGFLDIYNPTVTAMRVRLGWFPMPTFGFREWLVGLIACVACCFALTPLAARNVRWLRPLAWFYALVMFFNGLGHTAVTILGHTVASVPVARPAPGFYSSLLLFIGSVWLMMQLWKTASGTRLPVPAHKLVDLCNLRAPSNQQVSAQVLRRQKPRLRMTSVERPLRISQQ